MAQQQAQHYQSGGTALLENCCDMLDEAPTGCWLLLNEFACQECAGANNNQVTSNRPIT